MASRNGLGPLIELGSTAGAGSTDVTRKNR